jgi:PAS domain S-box-containing protein
MDSENNHRILIVDDSIAIHDDFRKILGRVPSATKLDLEGAALFGSCLPVTSRQFRLGFAAQGQDAVELMQIAHGAGQRYSVVFMDVRMPPGMDGIEAAVKLWEIDPDLQIVICTAYSDKSWEEMMVAVPNPERLLILKKPFDPIEVLQLAYALTEKWTLLQSFRHNVEEMERAVDRRTCELQASEERFRKLSAQAPIGIFETDVAGLCTYSNPRLQTLMGLSLAETIGEGWLKSIYPEDTDSLHAFWRTVVSDGSESEHEFRLRTPSGVIRWVYLRSALLRAGTGEVTGHVVSIEDITERKRAVEQIAEQAALLDKAQDAILVRDLEGRILFWNKGAEHVYGWTRQEALGRNIAELLYAHPKKFEEVNRLTITKGEWSGEFVHMTKDRRELIIEARWTLIRDREEHPKSVLAIYTDITEKKQMEAQFLRSQRMESIGTLAGGIAHDLNNILAPIMMSIDLLKAESDNPQTKRILETIALSAQRGADIVRQILSFARGLEGQRLEIQAKHLLKDLEHIIQDTFPKNIRSHFSVANDTWPIFGDSTQVQQILLNLCVNARDAMPNGGNLTVTAENCTLDDHYAAMNLEAKAGRYVRIDVIDSGIGMPKEVLDKIFEPFFTTKDLNKGTGLGLSTVMAIVEGHDGIIEVHSEPGQGTTFHVYLPAMEISAAARIAQTGKVSLSRGNGEMVLVVDDEASILTITSQTLEAFGYRVLTATDGADAIAIYTQHQDEIAVVLTDMMMPVMDGAATIRALMRINPAVKIIAASGVSANDGVAKASGVGVKHFLTKPYTAGTLLNTMRLILDEV